MKKIQSWIANNPIYVCGIAYACVIIFYIYHFSKIPISQSVDRWGQFGDYVGGLLNPLAGLVTILLVSQTLRSQIESSRKQEFDSQFFSLLEMYRSVLMAIDTHQFNGKVKVGRDSLYLIFKLTMDKAVGIKNINMKDGASYSTTLPQDLSEIKEAYEIVCEEKGHELNHYFRTVYHLFRHVKDARDKSILNEDEEKKYYDLIKSQLSRYEILLIKLNYESKNSGRWIDFKDRANIFEHLEDEFLSLPTWEAKMAQLKAKADLRKKRKQTEASH